MAHHMDLRQQESTLITEALYNQSVQPNKKHYEGTLMKSSLLLRFFLHMMIHAFYFSSLVKQWLSIAKVSRIYAYFMVHFMRLLREQHNNWEVIPWAQNLSRCLSNH